MLTQTEVSQDENGIVTVKLAGRLTLGSSMSIAAAKINQVIDEQGARKIILDLTGVEHADSSGLGLIIFTHGRLNELGGQLRLAGPNARLWDMFRMTRTDSILQIDANPDESRKQLET